MARTKRVVADKKRPTFTQSNSGQIGRRVIKIPRLTYLNDKGLYIDDDGLPWLCLASLHMFDKKDQIKIGEEILRRINGD